MKIKYIYRGETDVFVEGVGVVKRGDTVITDKKIIHPLFEIAKKKLKVAKKSK